MRRPVSAARIVFAVALATIWPAPQVNAIDPKSSIDTCNHGGPPRPCTCDDMDLANHMLTATDNAKQAWQDVKASQPATWMDAQKSFGGKATLDSTILGAIEGCSTYQPPKDGYGGACSSDADCGSHGKCGSKGTCFPYVELALNNWGSPIFDPCYCEVACEDIVKSTLEHENTHFWDNLRDVASVLGSLTAALPLAVNYAAYKGGNRMITDAGIDSELHAHENQAQYLADKISKFMAEHSCGSPTSLVPPAGKVSQPVVPATLGARTSLLLDRVVNGAQQ